MRLVVLKDDRNGKLLVMATNLKAWIASLGEMEDLKCLRRWLKMAGFPTRGDLNAKAYARRLWRNNGV